LFLINGDKYSEKIVQHLTLYPLDVELPFMLVLFASVNSDLTQKIKYKNKDSFTIVHAHTNGKDALQSILTIAGTIAHLTADLSSDICILDPTSSAFEVKFSLERINTQEGVRRIRLLTPTRFHQMLESPNPRLVQKHAHLPALRSSLFSKEGKSEAKEKVPVDATISEYSYETIMELTRETFSQDWEQRFQQFFEVIYEKYIRPGKSSCLHSDLEHHVTHRKEDLIDFIDHGVDLGFVVQKEQEFLFDEEALKEWLKREGRYGLSV
jgi:hypothetical protein